MIPKTENKTVAHPKINDSTVWFIYRPNGEEVRVNLKNGMVSFSTHKLTSYETMYLLENQIIDRKK